MRTRAKHLEWCKARALECLDKGDIAGAYASFVSDMEAHPETENHPNIKQRMVLMICSKGAMKRFIEGFG